MRQIVPEPPTYPNGWPRCPAFCTFFVSPAPRPLPERVSHLPMSVRQRNLSSNVARHMPRQTASLMVWPHTGREASIFGAWLKSVAAGVLPYLSGDREDRATDDNGAGMSFYPAHRIRRMTEGLLNRMRSPNDRSFCILVQNRRGEHQVGRIGNHASITRLTYDETPAYTLGTECSWPRRNRMPGGCSAWARESGLTSLSRPREA